MPNDSRPTPSKVHIIGVSDDGLEGLTSQAQRLILSAEMLLGPAKLLNVIPPNSAERIEVAGDLQALTDSLQKVQGRNAVLLTDGDPLFYGTARFLVGKFGKEFFEVVPHVSSMQLAFARVKESWDEAYLTNLASQPLGKITERIRSAEKVGLFTSDEMPPNKLADHLIKCGLNYFNAYVCENLGSPDERVTRGDLAEIAGKTFSPLNVVILVRKPGVPDRPGAIENCRMFGNPDSIFLQSQPKRGLLTPSEVRAIALSEMQLRTDSIVWDVGAGSGSVTIEAAMIASSGMAYGIEMDIDDYNLLVENAQRFGVRNVVPVHGEAPTAWENLPDPNAIFVGGTGRAITQIVEHAWPRLCKGGCLLASVADIENFAAIKSYVENTLKLEPQIWLLQFSRTNEQLGRSRLEALNPTFLLKVVKN